MVERDHVALERDLSVTHSVLFVTGSLTEEQNGVYLALNQTTRALQYRGHRLTVLGTKRDSAEYSDRWTVEAHAFKSYGPYSLHFAPELSRWLTQHPGEWDLASMQGVWLHSSRAVADWCIRHYKPYMITAHGNFNSQALKIGSWKKWLARRTFMAPVFEHATCYQALTEIEYHTLRKCGIREPICVIGNGIELPEPERRASEKLLPQALQGRRTCLYLGRLHPIKGIDFLLRAWGRARPSGDWQLIIAGDGDDHFRKELEAIARQSGCRNVYFVGFASSEVKDAWFRHSDLFVLPSRSEAFAMALLEAFAYGVPALFTTNCGFAEAVRAGAAFEVPLDDDEICAGLKHMLNLPESALRAMGVAARSFVRECYAWPKICAQLESVYNWMRGNSPAPESLRLD